MTFRSTKGASKQRRDQINSMIIELRDLLPLPETTRQRLSQLQVMSAVCVYVRKSNYFQSRSHTDDASGNHTDFIQSLPGFILVVSKDGKLVYISENVTDYLGHSMVDMMTQGDTIWDIVDKRDFNTLRSHLNGGGLGGSNEQKTFFCRMNVARTLRRQSSFREQKVMVVRGHFLPTNTNIQIPGTSDSTDTHSQPLFFALCTPLLTPELKESVFQSNTDVIWMEHTNDMKIQACSPLVEHYLGMKEEEVIGRSWYELLHPDDLPEARNKHIKVLGMSSEMGVMLTTRLQTAAGAWQCTSSVLFSNPATHEPYGHGRILSMHAIIRKDELSDFQLQCEQYSFHAAHASQYLSLQRTGLYMPPGVPTHMMQHHLPTALYSQPFDYSPCPPQTDSFIQQPQNTCIYGGEGMSTPDGLIAEFMMDSSSTVPDYYPAFSANNKSLKRKPSMDSCVPTKIQRSVTDFDDGFGDRYMAAGGYGNDFFMAEHSASVNGSAYNSPVLMRSTPVQYGMTHNKAALLHSDLPPTPECQPADRDIHDALTSSQTMSRPCLQSPCLQSPVWAPPTPTPASPCFVPTTRTFKLEPSVSVEALQLPQIKAEDVIDFFDETKDVTAARRLKSTDRQSTTQLAMEDQAKPSAMSMTVTAFDVSDLEWLERSFLESENESVQKNNNMLQQTVLSPQRSPTDTKFSRMM